MRDPKTCIVGEAWDFQCDYIAKCSKCSDFCINFYAAYRSKGVKFLTTVLRHKFMQHWNKEHNKDE